MKLAQFQKYLRKEKIDLAFFIHPDPTITYFTQLQLSKGILVVRANSAFLFTSKLDKKPQSVNFSVKEIPEEWEKKLAKLADRGIQKIGFNQKYLTVKNYEQLRTIFPRAKVVDLSIQLEKLRAQKTKEEINKLKTACQITDFVFKELIKELPNRRLNTELDVSIFLEKEIRKNGAELSFPPIVAQGKNSTVPHHNTSIQKLSRGFLLVDFGAKFENYCADMTRMLYLGTPTKKEEETYNLLLHAQNSAITKIKENITFSELDKVVKNRLGKVSVHFIHKLGHGVGVEIHESPTVSSTSEEIITKNMVFTVEPGIYFSGKFGMRIEDTVLFDGKVKMLTKSPKELLVVTSF